MKGKAGDSRKEQIFSKNLSSFFSVSYAGKPHNQSMSLAYRVLS